MPGVPVQGPPLRPVLVPSCLHEDHRGSPCPAKGSGHPHPQLSQRLANPSSLSRVAVRTKGPRVLAPQPTGALGQLGKEQALPGSEHVSMTARLTNNSAQSVLNCMKAFKQRTAVPLKLFQRLMGHMASLTAATPLVDAYETASALASDLSPEMGMAPRDTSRDHHADLSPPLQPLDRPCISTGRGSPRAGLQSRRGYNRRLQDGLGRRMQRAYSRRLLDWPAAVLAHQLPRVVGSAARPAEVLAVDPGQVRVGLVGQHSDGSVHQPSRRSMLPLHVTTHPLSPPLESAAPQVATSHSHPGRPQHRSGRAVMRSRVETPPSGGPADLESIQSSTGRPVCFPGILPLPSLVHPD
ncbi:uncharacterized protein LOC127448967 isoform X1 [Myxocyprinus asiaticus]|uniref:uncharacterized protein LOC127448967 isoform X1 n=1 Tax=Myxocyprinus asiaticus TaxID=70543 RepID=UPI00222308AE|nr:uncharacterized protein LOC127448967 isoform X1 [Myxocyprinus asiaticus]